MLNLTVQQGRATSYTLSFRQGTPPINCALVGAPTGVTLDTLNHVIDVAANVAAGVWNFTVRCANCGNAAASAAASILAVTLTVTAVAQPTPPPAPASSLPAGFSSSQVGRMTFNEEFRGGNYDPCKWRPEELWRVGSGDKDRNNYQVSNDSLKIWQVKNPDGSWTRGRTFTTEGDSYANENHRFSQKYGFFETEARVPNGPGHWPAFWLYAHPGNRRPEIDIIEAYTGAVNDFANGSFQPTDYGATVWDGPDGAPINRGGARLKNSLGAQRLDTAFHKYGLRWDASGMEFFFDGRSIGKVNYSMDVMMFIIISMGSTTGRTWLSNPDPQREGSATDQAFEVNYVRAWALPDGSTVTQGTCATPLS